MIARIHRRKCSRCGKIYLTTVGTKQWNDLSFWRGMGICPSCRIKAVKDIIKDAAGSIRHLYE